MFGANPCQRCIVPTRDPGTGIALEDFKRIFVQRRTQTLPPWANATRFDNAYRLAVNTRMDSQEAGKTLRVGDGVRIL